MSNEIQVEQTISCSISVIWTKKSQRYHSFVFRGANSNQTVLFHLQSSSHSSITVRLLFQYISGLGKTFLVVLSIYFGLSHKFIWNNLENWQHLTSSAHHFAHILYIFLLLILIWIFISLWQDLLLLYTCTVIQLFSAVNNFKFRVTFPPPIEINLYLWQVNFDDKLMESLLIFLVLVDLFWYHSEESNLKISGNYFSPHPSPPPSKSNNWFKFSIMSTFWYVTYMYIDTDYVSIEKITLYFEG